MVELIAVSSVILVAAIYFYFVRIMIYGLKKEKDPFDLPEKQKDHLGSNIKKLPEK